MKVSQKWYVLAFLSLSLALALAVAACTTDEASPTATPVPAEDTPTVEVIEPTEEVAEPTEEMAEPTEEAAGPPDALHEFDAARESCTLCHAVGDDGVGEPGGTGLPDSHEGRTDDGCQLCHEPAAAE